MTVNDFATLRMQRRARGAQKIHKLIFGFFLERIALFGPPIAMVMIAAHLPEAAPIATANSIARTHLRTLPP